MRLEEDCSRRGEGLEDLVPLDVDSYVTRIMTAYMATALPHPGLDLTFYEVL